MFYLENTDEQQQIMYVLFRSTMAVGRQGGIMIDVIIQRWENFTGSKAVLLQGE